jgi:AcrR family transcriptional regulator
VPWHTRGVKAKPRRRRSSEEARVAILDAAEARLREVGPSGIRLQEVAKAVGVSHPTVLHHFGSREGLIDAVVARSLDTIQAGVFDGVKAEPGMAGIETMLEDVAAHLKDRGRARTFLWLALEGYGAGMTGLQTRPLAEFAHEARRHKREGKQRLPPFEDTWFSIMLPALALLSLSVLEDCAEPGFDPARFRAWLAKLVFKHLES